MVIQSRTRHQRSVKYPCLAGAFDTFAAPVPLLSGQSPVSAIVNNGSFDTFDFVLARMTVSSDHECLFSRGEPCQFI